MIRGDRPAFPTGLSVWAPACLASLLVAAMAWAVGPAPMGYRPIRKLWTIGDDTLRDSTETILLSPSGDRVAGLALDSGYIVIWDTQTGRRLLRERLGPHFMAAHWHEDGKHLLLLRNPAPDRGDTWKVDAATGRVVGRDKLANPPLKEPGARFGLTWAAGLWRWVTTDGARCYLRNSGDGAALVLNMRGLSRQSVVCVAPDGGSVYYWRGGILHAPGVPRAPFPRPRLVCKGGGPGHPRQRQGGPHRVPARRGGRRGRKGQEGPRGARA